MTVAVKTPLVMMFETCCWVFGVEVFIEDTWDEERVVFVIYPWRWLTAVYAERFSISS